MAFQQGLSGLAASSKALDVISNNIANSNTVGFKAGRTGFTDVYAAALNGAAGGVQVGIGSAVAQVSQLFSQGNITTTGNPLDIAINGNGFFRMANIDGTVAYTRNGQFDVDKNGFIVNAQGYRLTGYPATNGVVLTGGDPQALQLDYSDVEPNITSQLTVGMNFDSRDLVGTSAPQFDVNAPAPLDRGNLGGGGYNYSTTATVYDSLGNSHNLTYFFVKTATPGEWELYYQVDGAVPATQLTNMVFDTNGQWVSGGDDVITLDFSASGADPAQNITLDFTNSSQYGSPFGVNTLTQDGFASGRLTGVTVGTDGVILGRYSNGQSRDLGQVVLANFPSPNGLLSLGGNLYAEAPDSGQPIIGTAGSANLGLLSAGSVEEANVDMTAELVALIVMQRAYQANAQSVRAQDQILQTIVNLR